MLLSFVIPCYNSSLTISPVVSEIIKTFNERHGYDYEIILVNDYSKDDVWHIIKDLCNNPKIRALNFVKNFGQQSALIAGYRYASGDIIVSLDDDGQAPINSLWSLIDKLLNENYDLVYGCYEEIEQNTLRRFGSFINRKMGEYLLDRPKNLNPTSFFVVRKFIINEIIKYENCYTYISGLMFRTTKNIGGVNVKHRKRLNGKSGYSFKRLLLLWINGLTAFSVKPLRIAIILGLIVSILGFFYGIYIIVLKLISPDVPLGYSSLMAAILFIGGIIMFLLGMQGEYIGRIYVNLNKYPQYVIRETINIENNK